MRSLPQPLRSIRCYLGTFHCLQTLTMTCWSSMKDSQSWRICEASGVLPVRGCRPHARELAHWGLPVIHRWIDHRHWKKIFGSNGCWILDIGFWFLEFKKILDSKKNIRFSLLLYIFCIYVFVRKAFAQEIE